MDLANITSIIDTADHTLFVQILTNPNQVLAHLLPKKASTHYKLRPRQHDRQLIPKTTKLHRCNFIVRMLYKHSYWLFIDLILFYVLLYKLGFVSLIIKKCDDDVDVMCSFRRRQITLVK